MSMPNLLVENAAGRMHLMTHHRGVTTFGVDPPADFTNYSLPTSRWADYLEGSVIPPMAAAVMLEHDRHHPVITVADVHGEISRIYINMDSSTTAPHHMKLLSAMELAFERELPGLFFTRRDDEPPTEASVYDAVDHTRGGSKGIRYSVVDFKFADGDDIQFRRLDRTECEKILRCHMPNATLSHHDDRRAAALDVDDYVNEESE